MWTAGWIRFIGSVISGQFADGGLYMTFPDHSFADIGSYFNSYAEKISLALGSVDRNRLAQAQALLLAAISRESQVFSCGNGGSAAISNHLVCDHVKGICADTNLRPRVQSLSSNIEMITAIANDLSYSEVFAWQLASQARPGDVLISISSSGDSDNVVKAVEWARNNDVKSIALTGFDGGRTARLADVNIHVQADNYGVVEDAHQSVMHVLAQFIRQAHMPGDLIKARRF